MENEILLDILGKPIVKTSNPTLCSQNEIKRILYRVPENFDEGTDISNFIANTWDLNEHGCFILDIGIEIYLWIGKHASYRSKIRAPETLAVSVI